jgi:hypothetical protein
MYNSLTVSGNLYVNNAATFNNNVLVSGPNASLTLYDPTSQQPSLYFIRNSRTYDEDTNTDWKITDIGGVLYINFAGLSQEWNSMTLLDNGKVGIGLAPNYKFQVSSGYGTTTDTLATK